MKSKSYVEKSLIAGEQIRYQGKVLPSFHLSRVPIFLVLVSVLFYVCVINFYIQGQGGFRNILTWLVFSLPMLLIFVESWTVIRSTEIAVTTQRVITTTGMFTQTSSELSLDKVESVDVEQGIIGRYLDYGTVTVNGTGGASVPAPGISNPFEFKRIVQEAVNERRRA